jgi:hypothetical protein
MLSSLLEVERAGRATPITSADSRRVETEERRRWWELRFAVGGVGPGCEREEMEVEEECEDESESSCKEEGKDSDCETEIIETLREWERECECLLLD